MLALGFLDLIVLIYKENGLGNTCRAGKMMRAYQGHI